MSDKTTKCRRYLVDVDGVVADLMGGFACFIRDRFDMELRPNEITTFDLTRSPAHYELNRCIDLDIQLKNFLAEPDCYDFVPVIAGAQAGITELICRGHQVAFVTATMRASPESYTPKFRWLAKHFHGVPMISCPAEQKWWIKTDFGIDDRFDTCDRWERAGATSILFRQPWNEAPPGTRSYDWKEIVNAF